MDNQEGDSVSVILFRREDVTAEQMAEAQGWVADCMGRKGKAPEQITMIYVDRHYPGGWLSFIAECCKEG
jgi:hypothetical protein